MLYFVRISIATNRFEYQCYHVDGVVYTYIKENYILFQTVPNIREGDLVYSLGGFEWYRFV